MFHLAKFPSFILYFCLQIVEICGANRVGHFGRSQFYIALKLIAMAQNAIPLPASKEMIAQGTDLPLPTFVAHPSVGVSQADPDDPGQMEFVNPAFIDLVPDRSAVLSGKVPPSEWHVGQVVGVAGPQPSPRTHTVYPHVEPAMSPTRTSHVPPLVSITSTVYNHLKLKDYKNHIVKQTYYMY